MDKENETTTTTEKVSKEPRITTTVYARAESNVTEVNAGERTEKENETIRTEKASKG